MSVCMCVYIYMYRAVVNSAILGPLLHSGAAGWIQPLGFVGFGVLFITGNICVVIYVVIYMSHHASITRPIIPI